MRPPLPGASPEAREHFWAALARTGTPVWNKQGTEATFYWRNPGIIAPGARPVHLSINRVTDKANVSRGTMHAIPGTDVWTLTLRLSPALRASYGFFVDGPPPAGPPPHNAFFSFYDPFNRSRPLARDGDRGLSVLAGPRAHPQPEWESNHRAPLQGFLHTDTVGGRPHWLYLPPQPPEQLLIIHDAEQWFERLGLPFAIEHAVTRGRLRPTAVLGISNNSAADRRTLLGGSLDFIATARAWASDVAGRQPGGANLSSIPHCVFAGFSLGGAVGIRLALEQPDAVDAVLAMSPSMWWQPDNTGSPRDLDQQERSWLVDAVSPATAYSPRIRLSVGSNETSSVRWVKQLGHALQSQQWNSDLSIYEGGHDVACWRGLLIDQLTDVGVSATMNE